MSNDWIEHNGGPQPVADDVWVRRLKRKYQSEPVLSAPVRAGPYDRGWKDVVEYQVINQHLIDAALKRGIELGLETAMKIVWKDTRWMGSDGPRIGETLWLTLRNLNPETIAEEADND